MLITPALAQSGSLGGGGFGGLMPIVLVMVIFYFLLIRPQQKKAKVHREMLGNVRRGDRIVTNGGLIGTITRVPNETELIIEVAEGVKVRVLRGMIAESLSKTEPAPAKKNKEKNQAQDDQDYDEAEEDLDADEDVSADDRQKD